MTRSLGSRITRKWRAVLRNAVRPIWVPQPVRLFVLRRSGIALSEGLVREGIRVLGDGLTVGRGTFINSDFYVEAEAPVVIGERVSIGVGAKLLTVSHEIGDSSRRAGRMTARGIIIGDGTWLGAGVTVLPGVAIGKGCVVGAGAVVTKDVRDNVIVAGVPAREVRQLE